MDYDGGNGYSRGGGGRGGRRGFRFRPYRGRRGWGKGQGFTSNRRGEMPNSNMMMPPPAFGGRGRGYIWRPGGGGGSAVDRQFSDKRSIGYQEDSDMEESMNSISIRSSSPPTTIDDHILAQYEKKFPGYQLYFGLLLPSIAKLFEKVDVVKQYLIRHEFVCDVKGAADMEENGYFDIKYEKVLEDQIFQEGWESFSEDLMNKPQDVLNIWGLAMHTIVFEILMEKEMEFASLDETIGRAMKKTGYEVACIRTRLMKMKPITSLKAIKSTLLGRFVTIRGAVVRTGTVRPQLSYMTFRCNECSVKFVIEQREGRFTLPSRCKTKDCESRAFQPEESEKSTKTVDSRKVRLQDIQHADSERGAVPRVMDCLLFNNLVNACNAGDAITMCGIVKMDADVSGGYGGDQSLHNLYLEVVALRNHKDSKNTMGGNWFSFTQKDYYAVTEIHDTENLFRLLVASICPTIYGHDIVKAGLLLCLFGGTPPPADSMISRRSDINILIVGDPGLGKSQLLSIVSEVAPRGVYVCGTASSVAGLTVTLVKEGDEYSLEAGALVMADRGVCCIDEFDKMQEQHHALLEAMEQQSISIAKSGVFRTLPARTSVIAAANPVSGHYNKAKTIAENIKISPPLLSRFDLTFILLDKSDEEVDRNIVSHIMGLRKSETLGNPITASGSVRRVDPDEDPSTLPLKERLKFDPDEEVDIISHHLIRKYIAYARQYVKPKLSKEAAAVIKEYYLKLRVNHRTIDSTPVTTRQLESLLRLTQARAKIELRELATEQDAKDVLEIFEFGMSGVLDDDVVVNSTLSQLSGLLGTSSGSSKSSTKNNAKKLVANLQRLAEQQAKNVFSMDEIKRVGNAMGLSGIENLVSVLNNEGFLLNKGGRLYQLQSADF